MNEIVVDTRGQSCPKPVVMTKNALSKLAVSGSMVVLVDNDTAKTNVENFLKSNGVKYSTVQKIDMFEIRVTKTDAPFAFEGPAEHSTCGQKTGSHVIAVKNNKMGFGSDELGEILIRACINTIQEITPLPGAIVFYNSGIELTLKDSPVLESLQELEKLGVKIIVCGTCVQHFKQKENVAVGTISNMYDIMEILSRASHVVYP